MTEPVRLAAHATNADHVAEGLALLTSQLKGKPVVAALLTSWLDQAQELEDAIWELYALAIDDSSDDALDQLGVVFRQPRPDGLSDALYRRVLNALVVALKSSGTGDDLLNAANAMITAWAFTLVEAFPATVLIEPTAAPSVPTATMMSVLRRVKSAGVGLQLIDVPSGDTFAFSSTGDTPEASATRGFSDTTMVAGGKLVGVVT